MRASVVIPCYNSLDFLPATVDSVLAQTFGDFELVLVDDGGTDDLAGWAATVDDPRVRVVRQDNAGVSAARNLGIDSARGELVVFLDSDDLWVPDALERLVACFDREPSLGLAYGGWDVIDAAGRPNGRVYVSTWEGDVWEQFVIRNPVPASAVAVPRAVLVDLGGFEVNRDRFPIDVEDWELWVRIAAGHRVAVVSDVLVHHRLHDRNSSSDVASLEAAYRHFLDTVFEGVDDDRLALRSLATARTELVLGVAEPERQPGSGRGAGLPPFRGTPRPRGPALGGVLAGRPGRHRPACRRGPRLCRGPLRVRAGPAGRGPAAGARPPLRGQLHPLT